MKKILLTIALVVFAFAANAQSPNQGVQMQQRWNNMNPQQREKARQNAYDKWKGMTPEQQQKMRSQAVNTWSNMTPEQKAKAMQQVKAAMNNMTLEQKTELLKNIGNFKVQNSSAQAR